MWDSVNVERHQENSRARAFHHARASADRRAGSHARRTADELAAAWAASNGVQLFVLGGGSNLVVADEGFRGLVLQIAISGVSATTEGDDVIVTAGAGESWDSLVEFAVKQDLAGIECLSGIPGHGRRHADSERRRVRSGGRDRHRVGDRIRSSHADSRTVITSRTAVSPIA